MHRKLGQPIRPDSRQSGRIGLDTGAPLIWRNSREISNTRRMARPETAWNACLIEWLAMAKGESPGKGPEMAHCKDVDDGFWGEGSNSPRREMLGSPRPRHWRHCSSHPRRGLSAHAGEESTSRHLYPRTSAGYVSCTCIHTCIHTYIHTYMYACIHTYILCLSVSESMPNILCE